MEHGPTTHQDSAGAEHRRLQALAPQIPAVAPGRPSVPIPVNSGGPPSAASQQVAPMALAAAQGAPSGGLAPIACSDHSHSTVQVSRPVDNAPPLAGPPVPTNAEAFPALPSRSTGLRGAPPLPFCSPRPSARLLHLLLPTCPPKVHTVRPGWHLGHQDDPVCRCSQRRLFRSRPRSQSLWRAWDRPPYRTPSPLSHPDCHGYPYRHQTGCGQPCHSPY